MKKIPSFLLRAGLPLVALSLMVLPAAGEEEEASAWSDTAEFSYVMTSGNSDTETLGFKNTATRTWERATFVLNLGGIRAESTVDHWSAVGTELDYTFHNEPVTSKTAENYYLNARYERKISDRFFWYGGAGWERNTFAGIQNRYVVEAGAGHVWYDREDMKFKTNYAITYTDQEDVVEVEGVDNSFVGARFSWAYLNKFGKNTTYENGFVADLNAEDTSRYRWNMINSLAVAMTDNLALKVSLQWLYEADPAFHVVDLVPELGADPIGTVERQYDKLDTVFTTSLVVNF